MPKPGKYNKPPTWKTQYNAHDGPSNHNRRVSFKQNRHSGGKGGTKDWGFSLRSHLEEEDVDMGTNAFNNMKVNKKHFKKNRGRQGSPPPNGYRPKGKLMEGPNNWYRVTLPYGTRYDKLWILNLLTEKLSPMELIPISWQAVNTSIVFFVDDYEVASKLYSMDRENKYNDGYNVIIKVISGTPSVEVNATLKDKMKLTMAKRYNLMTKALDLTRFHADPDLRDVFCALFKPMIFNAVVDIMAENIPDVEALNLHDNKLCLLSHMKDLGKKLPNLKILHMGNNKIRDISAFDSMTGLPILDLVLDGNPLCDRFREKEKYIRQCKIFAANRGILNIKIRSKTIEYAPLVTKDGLDLPPPIKFDVEEEMPLPNAQQTFLCNPEGQGIVRQFLEQYFELFDSDNRKSLADAYHQNASFSMTMSYPYGMHPKNSPHLSWYATDNRNLMRVNNPNRRFELLKQGQRNIINFLNEMPRTKHDIHSFTVDLSFFVPQMMVLTVGGMFKEVRSGQKFTPIRYFFRTLIIVPAGAGFCIANEVLHITNATTDQAQGAFKAPPPAPVTPVSTPVSAVPVVGDDIKQQMIKKMSEQSGMNLEWSQKCLEESAWDYQKAAYVFTELNNRKQIPPEAFAV